ncbi:MAG TPA: hypothetical protein DGR97_12640 [Gammaproteobacteria bacterium]|nr:hypothetical protein [Gammaproteobacteria bacterium]
MNKREKATKRANNRYKILVKARTDETPMRFFSESYAHNALLTIIIGHDFGAAQPLSRIHGKMAVFCHATKTSKIIQSACARGYLHKTEDPDDGRSFLIGATDLLQREHLRMVGMLYKNVCEELNITPPESD